MREEWGLRESNEGAIEVTVHNSSVQVGEEMVKKGKTIYWMQAKSVSVRVHLQVTENSNLISNGLSEVDVHLSFPQQCLDVSSPGLLW